MTVTTVCTTEPSARVVEDASITVEGGGVLWTRTDVVSGVSAGGCDSEDDCGTDELS